MAHKNNGTYFMNIYKDKGRPELMLYDDLADAEEFQWHEDYEKTIRVYLDIDGGTIKTLEY